MDTASQAFHYAFKVRDIAATRDFYHGILGCALGRETEHWLDINFFGHQISAHIADAIPPLDYCGQVDGISVPVPHFGVVLSVADFQQVQAKLEAASVEFLIAPYVRYEGKPGAQWTMFVFDPSNNPLEFKAFLNPEALFQS